MEDFLENKKEFQNNVYIVLKYYDRVKKLGCINIIYINS